MTEGQETHLMSLEVGDVIVCSGRADLQGAVLRYANLHGADLQGANLQGANL